MSDLSAELLADLRRHDTPTNCNGLELIDPTYRGRGYTTVPFVCAQTGLWCMDLRISISGSASVFLLIRDTPHVRLYVLNMFRMRVSRL